jgi:uncharacterized membrane protein
MLNELHKSNKLQETIFLAMFSFFCLGISVFRFVYTDTKTFLFLNWNLFLSFVPWALSSLLIIYPHLQKNKFLTLIVLGAWLLFFPNAPYILTDLFHLKLKSSVPKWFDLMLILSFAWTGLLFGMLSLSDIERILAKNIKPFWASVLCVAILFVASFGVYLGRFLRWNSWDIIQRPYALLSDIADRFLNPFDHPRTWGITILMGIFLNMVYWSLKLIQKRSNIKITTSPL